VDSLTDGGAPKIKGIQMPLGLHKFLRVLIPGIFLSAEGFLLYIFCFSDFPSSFAAWSLLSKDLGKTTGFALLAFGLGAAYHYFGITEAVDNETLRGMRGIRQNISDRLTRPFHSDVELGPRLSEVSWRMLRRIFFRFVDEIPHLATSNQLAFFSGLGFYASVDLATISLVYLTAILIGWLRMGSATLAVQLYLIVLVILVLVGVAGAKVIIRKHLETSNIQLDAILSDHVSELRDRILKILDLR
jgi:hypothetical protein